VTRLQRVREAATRGEPTRLVAPYTREALEALVARHGTPLFVIDCAEVRAAYARLRAALPGVELYYALKPLPEPAVVTTLKDIGAGFDIASSGEIELVRSQGVAAARCIHTHPIKRDADIRDALRFGIRTFVADNADELGKFIRHRQRVEVLLRVAFRAPHAVVDLSRKFGCDPQQVPELVALAARLGVRISGLSFHVGSQVGSPATYVEAIRTCALLLSAPPPAGTAPLGVLDIGGGFPVGYLEPAPPIDAFAAPIRAALAQLPPHVRVLAEPGRYIAAPAAICISAVVGRAQRDGRWWYYLDDGVYGSFSGQLYDHACYPLESLKDGPREPSVLAGPTCDSIDVVREHIELPLLEAGDLVVGRMMGAYTRACSTDFNFLRKARVIAVNQAADPPAAVQAVEAG
jgi:ornithine decarboxylase